jgi:hypothetical protein
MKTTGEKLLFIMVVPLQDILDDIYQILSRWSLNHALYFSRPLRPEPIRIQKHVNDVTKAVDCVMH